MIQQPGWIRWRVCGDSSGVANGNPASSELLTSLLRDVSRSFYLTLRVLPAAIRSQIGLAYLLARATDTIADTELVPVAERLAALAGLRERILGRASAPLDFRRFLAGDGAAAGRPDSASAAERVLLLRIEEALAVLAACDAADRRRINDVLDTITGGQELDLRRFGGAGERAPTGPPATADRERGRPAREFQSALIALPSAADLDDYTYRVAGCVGEFWTKMCRAHLFPEVRLDDAQLVANGIRFGKGLQLVNILRDLPKDLRTGRCYVPLPELATCGLTPADLLDPACEPRLRPVYDRWLDRAEQHLAAGWEYTNTLPRGQIRLRLACAWPVLIGLQTLRRLRTSRVLDPAARIKITRAEVRGIIVKTVLRLPSDAAWRRLAGPLPSVSTIGALETSPEHRSG